MYRQRGMVRLVLLPQPTLRDRPWPAGARGDQDTHPQAEPIDISRQRR